MAPHRTSEYRLPLGGEAEILVRYTTSKADLAGYAVVLLVDHEGGQRTVRCYDNAHGQHDMHRYNPRGIKEPAEVFHHGTPKEALAVALAEVRRSWPEMISGWRARP